MSGPMQWTPNGLVPALTSAGSTTIGAAPPQPLDTYEDDDGDDDGNVVVQPARRIAPAKPPAKPPKTKTVLQMARARLAEIDREVKRLRRLEREGEELRRLLTAAKTQPRAVVRELPKRTAG